ncbi:alpha-1,6-glucosidase domain-containing protein [Thermomonas carbonis]|nr:alpha-1,6-glucosidase domain-containing protein [Thermomonas carbonis]GHB96997.1 alpha-1,6-glucosidase [Thermomonas carbonis]
MRTTFALLLAASGVAQAGIDDCDGDSMRVLQPVAHAATDARGYWLDDTRIRWPGQPVGARYRLVASTSATLQVQRGAPVAGADHGYALSGSENVPDDVAARFRFVGAGATLALPQDARTELRDLLRGQAMLVHEDARGNVIDATYLQTPGALDALYAAAADDDRVPLGATPGDGTTWFRVWAPTAIDVSVCLYPDGASPAIESVPLAREERTGQWLNGNPRDLRGSYYTYLVDVFVPGVGIVRNRVTDPYSVSLTTDSRRSYIANLDDPALKPAGWDDAPRPPALASNTEMAIYELHVRDFSIGDASVPAAHRGKYLAFTDADSNGMRHLRALGEAGITDIHLLPVFDIATIPESDCVTPVIRQAKADSDSQQAAVMAVAAKDCFNWGYDPFHFNAPEGSYASDAADGAVRILELRAMVQALHAAGLRVGMDVVYNHTTASGQSPRSVLDRIVPGYYQRLDANGNVETSTCCDNTATEHPMMVRLMRDSVALWARDYRIDSFRFDLMGHQPRAAMIEVQRAANAAAGRYVPLVGEGWNFGEVANGARFPQAAQGMLNGSDIATFSDRARDALRGGGCCDSGVDLFAQQGLLNGLAYAPNASARGKATRRDLLHAADLARTGLAGTLREYRMMLADGRVAPLSALDYKGMQAGYASQPGEVVNYVENHDNPTLWDIHALKLPQDTSAVERARVQLLGAAFVAFSQGVPYFHAGMDVLRSKSLDRNSFDSGDWFNRLDWSYTDNGFGAGLPPPQDNGKDWDLLRPVLRNANAKPPPADIAWMRDTFRDLLRIRASSPLFHLRSADDVQRRLVFRNVGPKQNPLVVVGHLDGDGMPGAYREVLYLLNVSPDVQSLVLPEEAGKPYVLHPVQAADGAADARAKQARYTAKDGAFTVPGRTAVVFVVDTKKDTR